MQKNLERSGGGVSKFPDGFTLIHGGGLCAKSCSAVQEMSRFPVAISGKSTDKKEMGRVILFIILFIGGMSFWAGCASSDRAPSDDTFYSDPWGYFQGSADPNTFDNFVVERPMRRRRANDFQFYYKHCYESGRVDFSAHSYDCTTSPF